MKSITLAGAAIAASALVYFYLDKPAKVETLLSLENQPKITQILAPDKDDERPEAKTDEYEIPDKEYISFTLDGLLDDDATLIASSGEYSLHAKLDDNILYLALVKSATFDANLTVAIFVSSQGVLYNLKGEQNPEVNPNYILFNKLISVNPKVGGAGGFVRVRGPSYADLATVHSLKDVLAGRSDNVFEILVPRPVNRLFTSSLACWAIGYDGLHQDLKSFSVPTEKTDDEKVNSVDEIVFVHDVYK